MEPKFYKWIDMEKCVFVLREDAPPDIVKEYEECVKSFRLQYPDMGGCASRHSLNWNRQRWAERNKTK